jgi:hypothetical protein
MKVRPFLEIDPVLDYGNPRNRASVWQRIRESRAADVWYLMVDRPVLTSFVGLGLYVLAAITVSGWTESLVYWGLVLVFIALNLARGYHRAGRW